MKLKKIISKYQPYLLVIALILSSLAISIRSDDDGVKLVLHEHPILIFLLIVISSFLVAIYFSINRKKLSRLSDQIKAQAQTQPEGFASQLEELTERQREVYDMIISGKTNKEITAELYIEPSTLKTHINQIYKKLNIQSRRELKSRSKR